MSTHLLRRRTACLALASAAWPVFAATPGRGAGQPPLIVGVETALVECGFAPTLRRGFGAATGLTARVEAGPSAGLLQRLERGELDVALTQAPVLEARLESAGLSHDRHPVARGHFVLVGPSGTGTGRAIPIGSDIATALTLIAADASPFLSRGDGGGAHLAELELWRDATLAPDPAWYRSGHDAARPWLRQVAEAQAHALIDRSLWLAAPERGLRVVSERDPKLATAFHVQRPFHGRHPAARLFVSWAAGAGGRALVSRFGKGLQPA